MLPANGTCKVSFADSFSQMSRPKNRTRVLRAQLVLGRAIKAAHHRSRRKNIRCSDNNSDDNSEQSSALSSATNKSDLPYHTDNTVSDNEENGDLVESVDVEFVQGLDSVADMCKNVLEHLGRTRDGKGIGAGAWKKAEKSIRTSIYTGSSRKTQLRAENKAALLHELVFFFLSPSLQIVNFDLLLLFRDALKNSQNIASLFQKQLSDQHPLPHDQPRPTTTVHLGGDCEEDDEEGEEDSLWGENSEDLDCNARVLSTTLPPTSSTSLSPTCPTIPRSCTM